MAIGTVVLLSLLAVSLADGGSYTYNQNGADWTGDCATGQSQSPIDLDSPKFVKIEDGYQPIRIDYAPTKLFAVEKYNSIYKVSGSFGTLTAVNVDRTANFTYSSAQFHFHAPSEHSVGGDLYPVELHIVHVLTSSPYPNPLRYAVLGVLFQEGAHNPALQQYITSNSTTIDLGALFGNRNYLESYYMYKGSLTTPPCTEAVNWYVSSTILPASKEQIDFFRSMWEDDPHFADGKGNNREIMPLNGRELLYYSHGQLVIGSLLSLFLALY